MKEENNNAVSQVLYEKKGLIKCMVLSLVTLGIYGLVWLHSIMKKIKLLNGEKPSCAGEFLLSIFIPFYFFHWARTRAKKLSSAAAQRGITVNDNGGVYLFMCFFFSAAVVMLMMQNDLNLIARVLSEGKATLPEAQPAEAAVFTEPVEAAVPVMATAGVSSSVVTYSPIDIACTKLKELTAKFDAGELSREDYFTQRQEVVRALSSF